MRHGAASMGPPPFGGGNVVDRLLGLPRVSGFNGATAFRRWKPATFDGIGGTQSLLQWGHRLSAVETWS